jgi:hypothetical protein
MSWKATFCAPVVGFGRFKARPSVNSWLSRTYVSLD